MRAADPSAAGKVSRRDAAADWRRLASRTVTVDLMGRRSQPYRV